MSDWLRVTRDHPCPICRRPDWCTYTAEVACCMRVESAVPAKNGGHIHRLTDRPAARVRCSRTTPDPPVIDPPTLLGGWLGETRAAQVEALAFKLGVTADSLQALGAAWAARYRAWAFGMQDGQGNVIGIRLRAEDGRKWAVTGSHQGIFVPDVTPQDTVLVCEGPTDTAAALSLGYFAIGRPSCCCGGAQIRGAMQRLGIRQVVMVADNDLPGLAGAQRTALEIGLPAKTICPPAKDLRSAVVEGVTREVIDCLISNSSTKGVTLWTGSR